MIQGGHLVPDIWLPSGITLGLGLLRGPIVVPGIILGHMLVYMMYGSSWELIIAATVGNAVEVTVSSIWIRKWLKLPGRLLEPRDVFPLILVLAVSVNISALIGCAATASSTTHFLREWWMWWAGDMVAVLALTPILIHPPRKHFETNLSLSLERSLFFLLLIVCMGLLFLSTNSVLTSYRLEYLPFLFIAWATLRLGSQSVTLANGAILLISALGTVQKRGPFGNAELLDSYNRYWAFAGIAGIASIWLSALSASRDQTTRELSETNIRLHNEVKERRRTEAALETQSENLRATLASIFDGVITTDREGKIEVINVEGCRLVGLQSEKVLGHNIRSILRFKDSLSDPAELLLEILKSGISIGNPHSTDTPRQLDNPLIGLIPVTLVASPLLSGLKVMGMVIAMRDVSQVRELERMKSDFVASVSHELRTPLTSIKGFLDILHLDSSMPAETRSKFLGIACNQTARLMTLITDILQFSRLRSNPALFPKISVDLKEICSAAHRDFSPQSLLHKQSLTCFFPDEQVLVRGDLNQLRSAVENLVGNACKFTQDGGAIEIRIVREGSRWILSVCDNGPGIPAEHLERIFDRFYRFERVGQVIAGTGLGLAIVQEIANNHGSKVSVRSEPNLATEFTLPLEAFKALADASA